jgi:hypothetical protein
MQPYLVIPQAYNSSPEAGPLVRHAGNRYRYRYLTDANKTVVRDPAS